MDKAKPSNGFTCKYGNAPTAIMTKLENITFEITKTQQLQRKNIVLRTTTVELTSRPKSSISLARYYHTRTLSIYLEDSIIMNR